MQECFDWSFYKSKINLKRFFFYLFSYLCRHCPNKICVCWLLITLILLTISVCFLILSQQLSTCFIPWSHWWKHEVSKQTVDSLYSISCLITAFDTEQELQPTNIFKSNVVQTRVHLIWGTCKKSNFIPTWRCGSRGGKSTKES